MEMPKLKIQIFARRLEESESAVSLPWRCRIHEVENSSDLVHVQRVLVVRIQENGLQPVIQFCVMKQNGNNVLTKREKTYRKLWTLILHPCPFLPWILSLWEHDAWSSNSCFCNLEGSGEVTQAKPEPWEDKSVEHTTKQPGSGFPVMWDDKLLNRSPVT